MEPASDRTQTKTHVFTDVSMPGLCTVLVEEAFLLDRLKAYALPNDFVPGCSVQDTLELIRHQYTNYEEILDELELACIDRVTAGGRCPFSRDLASGMARHKCPFLAMLCGSLTALADQQAEKSFAEWHRRCERHKQAQRYTYALELSC